MASNHITSLLEERPVSRIAGEDAAVIEAHIAGCPECRRAYEAALIGESLIRARLDEAVDVSPFFNTRVMAGIRERRLSREIPLLVRMWKAAGAMVLAMAALVVVLIGATVFDGSEPDLQLTEATPGSLSVYSPEYVVLEIGDLEEDTIQYDQVLGAMYSAEDDDGN
jgi:predicted anti-sigma-YlaC factor YlaD